MKNILVIGKNSYIGKSFQKWMQQQDMEYEIDSVSSRNNEWKKLDFGKYDAILHAAGIAHVDAKADMEQQYYAVNRDLTIACCKKAKEDGARQFIFLSSIIVYGESKSLEPVIITSNTKPEPNGFYGRSNRVQLREEQEILLQHLCLQLSDRALKVRRLSRSSTLLRGFSDLPLYLR